MNRTIISHIGITPLGILEIQMRKQLVVGEVVHDLGFHRVSAAPGADVEMTLAAVNADLQRMDMAPLDDAEWNDVRAVSKAIWTERKRKEFADMLTRQIQQDQAKGQTSEQPQ